MLRRAFFLLLTVLAAPALAGEHHCGELVFIKDDACVTLNKVTMDHSLIRFPSPVEAQKDGLLWIARGWVKPCDVMSAEEAFAYYTHLTETQPNSAAAWSARSAVLLTMGDAEQALNDANNALVMQPKNPVFLVRRGDALTALNLHDEALKDYCAATKCQPTWPTALVSYGDALARRGDLQEACDLYVQCKALDPLDPYCYFGFANCRLALCDYKKSAEAYTCAIKCDPFFTAAYLNRSETWRAVRKYDAVVIDLTYALKCDPTMAIAHLKRAQAWDDAGKYVYASQDFNDAVRLEPANADAQKELARFLAACKDARFRNGHKAIEHASTAVELTSHSDPEALAILAAAYGQIGDVQQAVYYEGQAAATAQGAIITPAPSPMNPRVYESNTEELPSPPKTIRSSETLPPPAVGPALGPQADGSQFD